MFHAGGRAAQQLPGLVVARVVKTSRCPAGPNLRCAHQDPKRPRSTRHDQDASAMLARAGEWTSGLIADELAGELGPRTDRE